MELTDRVAVITGAGSGVGAAAARLFARSGASVVVADISRERGALIAEEIEASGGSAVAIQTDVTSASSVADCVAGVVDRFGRIDVVCPNAGIAFPEAPMTDTSEAEFDKLVGVNLKGVFLTLRAAIPHVTPGGSVVITSSISGLMSHPGDAVYAATKIAVIGLGRSLAMELSPKRIRVNAVCPGGIDTPLTHGAYGDQAVEVIAGYRETNPLGRIAEPEDIAEAMLFLASDRSRHINGVALRVDGGDTLMGCL